MVSILRRPLDLLIVLCFTSFLFINWTIDLTQTLYGPIIALENVDNWVWPPASILKSYAWWCQTYDPLVAHYPMWFQTMSWFSPFLYAPFYIAAIYAFMFEREWIRIPALLWGYGLLLTMFVVVREELFGHYAAPDPTIVAAAYGGYIMVPVIVMLRVAWTPLFKTKVKRE